MKIHIKKENFDFEELKYHLANSFPKYKFWELPKNQILIEKNKVVGCYIIPSKNKMQLICGFSDIRINLLAVILTILGGIIVPIILYYLIFYGMHKKFELKITEEIFNMLSA